MRAQLGSALLLAAWVLLVGCGEQEVTQRQASSPDEGIQATGRIDGQRVAISYGDPEVVSRDCDPNEGLDEDVCLVFRTIDGMSLNLVIENPGVLRPRTTVEAGPDDCAGDACDAITDHVVVELRVDGEPLRATGGRLEVDQAGARLSASFDLRFPGGDELNGRFDVPVR